MAVTPAQLQPVAGAVPGAISNQTPALQVGVVRRRSRGNGFGFTRPEKRALLAFLKTLTDEKFVSDPRFSDPFVRP